MVFCWSMPIKFKSKGVNKQAKIVKIIEMIKERTIWVANDFLTPSKLLAPILFELATEKPAVHPKANCKTININEYVTFTPATSLEERVFPTIAASEMV